jgi:hypothetical protein
MGECACGKTKSVFELFIEPVSADLRSALCSLDFVASLLLLFAACCAYFFGFSFINASDYPYLIPQITFIAIIIQLHLIPLTSVSR